MKAGRSVTEQLVEDDDRRERTQRSAEAIIVQETRG
jgi:hypothetical protein